MRISKIIISLFLSLSIFISSSGVVLASHICLLRPVTKVSLFSANSCCKKSSSSCHSKHSTESTFEKRCCLMKISFHQVNVSAIVKSHISLVKSFLANIAGVLTSGIHFVAKAFHTLVFRGPPVFLTGVGLLHFIHSLLI